jgi:ATP-dependent RNA helicase DDX10/DBP4
VIPVFERLFRQKWSTSDGCGALIISPTRELALQIFEVVKQVGQAHFGITAGVLCGGNSFADEQEAVGRLCVIVATPGRLLQHLEQTPDFNTANLTALVLDEADRLLDMGFADTLNAILSYLPPPPQRQTLLFSATQTKSVKDLARLSLAGPQYLAVHEAASAATPLKLQQTYVVCRLQDKLNLLYSFVRTHLAAKTIVFLSSCKQSRYVFEVFRRLRPGVPLQLLHGKMKQKRRQLVYFDFLKKPACVLFATDIAARGLDFPSVDWVVQLDCPEDVQTYIHRVGRTARFRAKGHGMLVLQPAEAKAMVPALEAAKIPISQVKVNPATAIAVTGKVAAEVAADADLKSLAQKAFSSYVRSVYLQTDKAVFNVATLPLQEYAESLGLAVAPQVKISKRALAMDPEKLRASMHAKKNENKALAALRAEVAAEGKGAGDKKAARAGAGGPAGDSDDDDEDEENVSDEEGDEGSGDDDDDESDAGGGGAGKRRRYRELASSEDEDSDEDDDGDDASGDDDEVEEDGSDNEGSSDSEGGSDSDDAEGLLVRKKAAPGSADAATGGSGSAAPNLGADVPADVAARMSDKERARLYAIIRDTKLLGEGGAKRGSDGLTPFQRIAAAKAAAAAVGAGGGKPAPASEGASGAADPAAAAAFAARVAKRLAATSAADREHEQERIRGKHREARLRAKGIDPAAMDGEEEEGEEEEGDEAEGSGSDGESSDSGSGGDEEKRVGWRRAAADSDSDDHSSTGTADSASRRQAEEEEAAARRRRAMVMVAAAPAAAAAAVASAAGAGVLPVTGAKRKQPYQPVARDARASERPATKAPAAKRPAARR